MNVQIQSGKVIYVQIQSGKVINVQIQSGKVINVVQTDHPPTLNCHLTFKLSNNLFQDF